VNHGGEAVSAAITTSLSVKSLRQIEPDGSKPLSIEGSTWKMELQPYEADIVEWK
jgi:hypothetical protein